MMNETCKNCKHWGGDPVNSARGECRKLVGWEKFSTVFLVQGQATEPGPVEQRAIMTPPGFGCNKFEVGGPFSVRLAFNSFNVVYESQEIVAMGSFGDAWPAERLARQLNRLWKERTGNA